MESEQSGEKIKGEIRIGSEKSRLTLVGKSRKVGQKLRSLMVRHGPGTTLPEALRQEVGRTGKISKN